ncbi:MAG: 50S ribosome-binding GTPase [Spiroplasmataceae bacterium]|nr:50S ribosome-binding GTPase [Spiroplasmataceae bacterium]
MTQNINAQKYLDEKYPPNGTCSRSNDPENKGKTRKGITLLDLRKGKVGNGMFSRSKNLAEDCKLTDFPSLRKLIISAHQLTSLDVSNLSNLEELDCRSNELTSLKVDNCINLKKIDCSNNPLRTLDLSTCLNLAEVSLNGCTNLTESVIKSQLFYDIENKKLIKNKNTMKVSPQITKAQDKDIRNILIVGWTGNGKSNLANSLTNDNQFVSGCSGVSVTEGFKKSNIFDWQGKKYRVVDNIGFGDNSSLSKRDLLFKIGEGIHATKEGLNQILFVIKGRFSEEQIGAFNLFKDFINETEITKFTTIVKTSFKDFRNPDKCLKDKEDMLSQRKEIKEIIDSCNNIVYVDNPAIPEIDEDDSDNEKEIIINNKKRKESREKLLNHLVDNCLEIYKLKEWDSIWTMVDNYFKKERELNQSNDPNKERKLNEEKNDLIRKVDKSIEGSLGLSIPGLPVGFKLGFKKMNIQEEQTAKIEFLHKEI